ncbi:MAG TPA: biotin--[acetyl-CoA-carboxylase] ligase [Alphaproteobacteria bacterium]
MTRAPKLPPPFSLVALESVDSTNSEARRRAEAGAPDGTVVWARSQSAGRGRRGRAWQSPPGNLYVSVLLRPDLDAADCARLTFLVAVALGDALAGLLPPLATIAHKWPNDVLVNGRKCAGILIESATSGGALVDWLVIGVGVNLAHHPGDAEFPATDLAFEGAGEVTPEAALEAFARHLLRWLDVWGQDGFAPVRAAWLARAWRIGEPIEVRLDSRRLSGRFERLDDDGALIVAHGDGSRTRIEAGAVFPPTP